MSEASVKLSVGYPDIPPDQAAILIWNSSDNLGLSIANILKKTEGQDSKAVAKKYGNQYF